MVFVKIWCLGPLLIFYNRFRTAFFFAGVSWLCAWDVSGTRVHRQVCSLLYYSNNNTGYSAYGLAISKQRELQRLRPHITRVCMHACTCAAQYCLPSSGSTPSCSGRLQCKAVQRSASRTRERSVVQSQIPVPMFARTESKQLKQGNWLEGSTLNHKKACPSCKKH